MALTRPNVETILIKRVGTLFTEAGMDGVTVDGTNADLNDPIGYSVRKTGYTVANVTNVADSDLSPISEDDYDALFDIAELRALESALQHITAVDIVVDMYEEDFSQLANRLQKTIDAKRAQVEAEYGLGRSSLEAGVITIDFAEHDDSSEF